MKRSAFRLVMLLTTVSLVAGCGYTVHPSLDDRYQSIHIEPFKNTSREFDLQVPLTNAVIRRFMQDSRLRVVSAGQADLVLRGTILEYELQGTAFGVDDEVTQFITQISTGVEVVDARTGEILWSDPEMFGETSFLTRPGPIAATRSRGNSESTMPQVRSFLTLEENRAATNVLDQLASDIFFRTIEPW